MGKNIGISNGTILDYWQPWLEENHEFLITDIPECWGCRRTWSGPWNKEEATTWQELKNMWNACKSLVRCHIVPDSLGGDNSPDNLFLMCRACHDEAPDTSFRDVFFKWFEYKQKNNCWVQQKNEMKMWMKVYLPDSWRGTEEQWRQVSDIMTSDEFGKWYVGHVTSHVHAQHGGIFKFSTRIGALAKFMEVKGIQLAEGSDHTSDEFMDLPLWSLFNKWTEGE